MKSILFALCACLALPAAIAAPAAQVSSLPFVEFQPTAAIVGTTVCGGIAPSVTACSASGYSTVATFSQLGTTVYTGTLVSTLTWTDGWFWGTYTLVCDYVTGVWTCFHGPADLPPPWPVWWTLTCDSYDIYTTWHGGSGQWACNVLGV